MKLSQTILTTLTCAAMGLSLTAHAAVIDGDENHHNLPAVPLATNQYLITNVTVNAGSGAPNKDAKLVNPWGASWTRRGGWRSRPATSGRTPTASWWVTSAAE
jgi:hypothetical protein